MSPIARITRRDGWSFVAGVPLLIALFLWASPATACPFCAKLGKTLSDMVADADWVAAGRLSGSRRISDAGADQPDAVTEMVVTTVIKSHPSAKGKESVTLARFFARAQGDPVDYLIFAEIVDGRIDPFRAIPTDSTSLARYLAKSARLSADAPSDRLGALFPYLNDKDPRISEDAYKEYSKAPFHVVRAAAKHYDSDRLIEWLRDPATPAYRIGLFGLLTGAAGRAEDADLLRAMITEPRLRPADGIDGLLGGYSLLRPREGADLVLELLNDSEAGFKMRYLALLAFRFVRTDVPGLDRDTLLERLAGALEIPELCDLVVDELRKARAWDRLDRILSLYGKTGFDRPVIQRTVVRFAVQCPLPKAKRFVARIEADNPKLITDVRENLRFEKTLETQSGTKGARRNKSPNP